MITAQQSIRLSAYRRRRFNTLSDRENPLPDLLVFFHGLFNDLRRQRGRRAVLVPCRRFKVVPDELFVEADGRCSNRVLAGVPETRAVGVRSRLSERSRSDKPEFELGIREDYAGSPELLARVLVNLERQLASRSATSVPSFLRIASMDIHVVAGFRLGRGREQRRGKLLGHLEPFRKPEPQTSGYPGNPSIRCL